MESQESKRPKGIIEALPDEILVKIFSLLPIEELFMASFVSHRWRELWKSHPKLDFHYSTNHPCYKRIGFHNFVDHVLRLRRKPGASSIKTFRLRYLYSASDIRPEQIQQCIVTAVNQGVQEIDVITTDLRDSVDLADSRIFNSTTKLTVFKFAEFGHKYATQLPQSICLPANLRCLNIFAIRLPKGNRSEDELELCFPALEKLVMTDCCHKHLKVLNISAPKLNTLAIRHDTRQDVFGRCTLELCTPHLTTFRYKGRSYADYTFIQSCLPLLEDASVTFSSMDRIHDLKLLHASTQLLKGLYNAKSLTLQGFDGIFSSVTNALTKEPPLEYQFASLRELELKVSARASSTITKMAYLLLNSCNMLESFVWHVLSPNHPSAQFADWRSECISPGTRILRNLKLVKILDIQGHENVNEFVKFLLKTAVVLKELIITSTEENLWAMETIETLARSSPRFTKKSQTLTHTFPRRTTLSLEFSIDFHPAN